MPVSITTAALLHAAMQGGALPCIVDARTRREYEAGHIPGAILLEWEDWCGAPPDGAAPVLSTPGYWGTLSDAPAAWWEAQLQERGVIAGVPITVYADGLVSKGREGRIAWMLLYLGAERVSLLDGGWTAWTGAGFPTELGSSATTADVQRQDGARPFTVSLQPARRWTREAMGRAFQDGRLPLPVDTRTPLEFAGDCYDYLPRKGRLPGSIYFAFADLFDGDHYFAARDLYLSRLPAPLRVTPAQGVATYCEVGVRAALTALLHEVHTGEVIGVFDGSLIEWALDAALPVIGPPGVSHPGSCMKTLM